IPLRVRYFGWMVLESAVYAVFTALLVSGLVGAILSTLMQPVSGVVPYGAVAEPLAALQGVLQSAPQSPEVVVASGGLLLQLALSVGAGVYEELLFRVLLVGGLFLGLRKLTEGGAAAYVVAAVIGAFLFSLVHYIGPLGDVLEIGSFLFRFLFGLVLNVLFLVRGFGIAAWTHALYDVMVVTSWWW
ncbi:MAG: CPBP family glutamic-type intramembrane protease, partial [Rhodothermales bacterium]